jgi:hypothetical protein
MSREKGLAGMAENVRQGLPNWTGKSSERANWR